LLVLLQRQSLPGIIHKSVYHAWGLELWDTSEA